MKRVLSALGATAVGLTALLSYRTPPQAGVRLIKTDTNVGQDQEVVPPIPTTTSTTTAGSAVDTSTSTTATTASSTANRSTTSSTGSTGGSTAPTTSIPSTTTTQKPTSTTTASKTYTGTSVDTRWGAVQVQITVKSGKITDVQAIDYPTGNSRDVSINARALPILRSEALAAQSANIDSVSGATVTSEGYIGSLQSAIDAANL